MTDRTRSASKGEGVVATPSKRKRPRRRPGTGGEDLDHVETISHVCRYFCEGRRPSEIKTILKAEHGIDIPREQPYRYLAHAAKQGWIRFVAPPEYALRDRLQEAHAWLQGVQVAHTAVLEDVALHTAKAIVDLLRSRAHGARGRKEVHVGFAGGRAMRSVAQHLAALLRGPADGMPESVVFHALVAGFDLHDPTTDPNAFFTYFVDDSAMPLKTRFVGLHAPPIIESEQFAALQKLDGIKQAFTQGKEIDIVVTSGGSWQTPCSHSMLRDYMERSPESIALLQKENCCGDMLWRPLSANGPITRGTKIRAMTLLELTDLARFAREGKAVLFMLGPCRHCNQPRVELLRSILAQKDHLITHLITDSRTAAGALR